MSSNIFALIICLLAVVLDLRASYCEAYPRKAFKEPAKYCGPMLVQQLHNYCQFFSGPDNYLEDPNDKSSIAEECCESPCTIHHIITRYCIKPKHDAIRRVFGEVYIDSQENSDTLEKDSQVKPADTMQRKKNIRKHQRKKRNCKCKKNHEQAEKEKLLLARIVPEYVIGLVDYNGNEPVIISNSL